MVAPGLFERIISPAIRLARTSRTLGDTDKANMTPREAQNYSKDLDIKTTLRMVKISLESFI